ncbi:MAG: polyprenyl synthetase family protein [Phycisphaerales bacterium]
MQGILDIPEELQSLEDIVSAGFSRVETLFAAQLVSDLEPVDQMCQHVERYRGKMLRPMLVLLCGSAVNPELSQLLESGTNEQLITNAHITCGAVCEMVHMATLVHDDVLDEAEIRRRGRTINAIKGNETSVILGDYLIASAYELCSSLNSPVPSRIVGNASAVMCTGELLQLHNRDNLNLDEDTYFEILKRKTAALIAAACELGALSTIGFDQQSHPSVQAVINYGTNLGIAFQIQDDVLDLTGTLDSVGKSVGKDLEKGKMTYPLIHHLTSADPEMRARSIELITLASSGNDTEIKELIELVTKTGSIEATQNMAQKYVDQAKASVANLPAGPGRPMLELIADAVINRSH